MLRISKLLQIIEELQIELSRIVPTQQGGQISLDRATLYALLIRRELEERAEILKDK